MIKIFGSTLSPFVRKSLAFAAEKGVEVESIPLGLNAVDPDFLAASPFRKIPALQDGDFRISDSTAMCFYLEGLKADPQLIPTENKARARTIWYDEIADTILSGCGGKMFFNRIVSERFLGKPGDKAMADKAEAEELPPILAWLESAVPASGYLVGENLTLADIAIASTCVNLDHCSNALRSGEYPRLVAYLEKIHSRPSFANMIAKEKAFLAKAA